MEKKDSHYYIYENGCPYFHIGQAHPEICSVDQTLISKVMNIPVEKVSCVLTGGSSCVYSISKETRKVHHDEYERHPGNESACMAGRIISPELMPALKESLAQVVILKSI
jgi:hypothetical protein